MQLSELLQNSRIITVNISAAECRKMALFAAVQTPDESARRLVVKSRLQWLAIGSLSRVTVVVGCGWKVEHQYRPLIGRLQHVTRRYRHVCEVCWSYHLICRLRLQLLNLSNELPVELGWFSPALGHRQLVHCLQLASSTKPTHNNLHINAIYVKSLWQ